MPPYKYKKAGVPTSTGVGKFDHVEYNTETGTMTITVRPSFTFHRFSPPMDADPFILAQWPLFMNNIEIACKTTFKMMVEAWGGHHQFVCTEPGMTHLYANVRCEVEEILSGEPMAPGTYYTPVIFGNVGDRAHMSTGSIVVDHSDGYVLTPLGGIITAPIVPSEYLSLALGAPPASYRQYTIMHELGHSFGLGDEYVGAKPGYAYGNTTHHSNLASAELGQNVFHGWNDNSIMATGGEIMPVHGVTFLAALRNVTGLQWRFS